MMMTMDTHCLHNHDAAEADLMTMVTTTILKQKQFDDDETQLCSDDNQ